MDFKGKYKGGKIWDTVSKVYRAMSAEEETAKKGRYENFNKLMNEKKGEKKDKSTKVEPQAETPSLLSQIASMSEADRKILLTLLGGDATKKDDRNIGTTIGHEIMKVVNKTTHTLASKDIPTSDQLDEVAVFFSSICPYMDFGYPYKGQSIKPPYYEVNGSHIQFNHHMPPIKTFVTDPRTREIFMNPIHFSIYTTWSRKEKEYLENVPGFGIVVFKTLQEVLDAKRENSGTYINQAADVFALNETALKKECAAYNVTVADIKIKDDDDDATKAKKIAAERAMRVALIFKKANIVNNTHRNYMIEIATRNKNEELLATVGKASILKEFQESAVI